jgi:hypothetical protein
MSDYDKKLPKRTVGPGSKFEDLDVVDDAKATFYRKDGSKRVEISIPHSWRWTVAAVIFSGLIVIGSVAIILT